MNHSSRYLRTLIAALTLVSWGQAQTVARQWIDECLQAIRTDFPAPTVHARNLYHLSAAMYDAWASYDSVAVGLFHHEKSSAANIAAARNQAISYAAYRVLYDRYSNNAAALEAFDQRMFSLGYNVAYISTTGNRPDALGNRCAAKVIAAGQFDGSNQAANYVDPFGYTPRNTPLIVAQSGAGNPAEPTHWQPLAFDVAMTQNGLVADKVQRFIGSHWGRVSSFALSGSRPNGWPQAFDPGAPPSWGGSQHAAFRDQVAEVLTFSARMTPSDNTLIDISPASFGNNSLGTNDGHGHNLNPSTGQRYTPQWVKRGDYARVLAEFWADGPNSETPPGHWNVVAGQVADAITPPYRIAGQGAEVTRLEWDVKLYLSLNAALHDAAIAAWGIKAHYDTARPITSIRHMASLGQCSDPQAARYHPLGLPLIPGLIELVSSSSSAVGQRHAGLSAGQIAVLAWAGEPSYPAFQVAGTRWINAENWLPYQRKTFVTPAFAGYVSGHSTFSRAAAEVLTAFTDNRFFPSGLARYAVLPGDLKFEYGPSSTVELQWATYRDAADQAGISRLYGGIHLAADDLAGRRLGAAVGQAAWQQMQPYFQGIVPQRPLLGINWENGQPVLEWRNAAQAQDQLESSDDLQTFSVISPLQSRPGAISRITDSRTASSPRFYRLRRQLP